MRGIKRTYSWDTVSSQEVYRWVFMLRLLTLNTHKGFSSFNFNFILPELREAIRETEADVVFLQEVVGDSAGSARFSGGIEQESHYEFLADSVWSDFAYGKNAAIGDLHYGNAILSKYPIAFSQRIDISTNRLEKRGFVYARVDYVERGTVLHCISVHFGLWRRSRRKQTEMLLDFINREIPSAEPLVIGGDFNDWTERSTGEFRSSAGLAEVYTEKHGRDAATYPAWLPLLKLDRIYVRGFEILDAKVFQRGIWSRLSDHAALFSTVRLREGAA